MTNCRGGLGTSLATRAQRVEEQFFPLGNLPSEDHRLGIEDADHRRDILRDALDEARENALRIFVAGPYGFEHSPWAQ
jgi:hypothetical protein